MVKNKYFREVNYDKKIIKFITALIMAVSLAGALPSIVEAVNVGEPVEGYVCTYYENSDGYWEKSTYDSNGNEIYWEDSNGEKYEYDSNGNKIYHEFSGDYWKKQPMQK